MQKHAHEIRDPIHVFIRLDSDERRVVDSRPFQRLRHVHQLALTYLVYPGATHRRFEHSLGVMELAGRVFDVVTDPDRLTDEVREMLPEVNNPRKREYWRVVLRMAALCHDLGHLPFSHAAEAQLLPQGVRHEHLSRDHILSDEMQRIWSKMKVDPHDVAKLAVGPKYSEDTSFTSWELILSGIVTSDAFGVDRMDYLLRDSHHAGVAYGKFDHHRLVDTLRLLPYAPEGEPEGPKRPVLGVEEGGLQSAEALLLARYFMYSQLYFHPVRRIYDIHLQDFLKAWLPDGRFPIKVDQHLAWTDNEVTAGLLKAGANPGQPGHAAARRIVQREHFKRLYEPAPGDIKRRPEIGKLVFREARERFGVEHVRHDDYSQGSDPVDFPVQRRDGKILSARALSSALSKLPLVSVEFVFVSREKEKEARDWLDENLSDLLSADTAQEGV